MYLLIIYKFENCGILILSNLTKKCLNLYGKFEVW